MNWWIALVAFDVRFGEVNCSLLIFLLLILFDLTQYVLFKVLFYLFDMVFFLLLS